MLVLREYWKYFDHQCQSLEYPQETHIFKDGTGGRKVQSLPQNLKKAD